MSVGVARDKQRKTIRAVRRSCVKDVWVLQDPKRHSSVEPLGFKNILNIERCYIELAVHDVVLYCLLDER